ncbi:acyl carrier protein, partial [Actinomadura bangladeshensis]
ARRLAGLGRAEQRRLVVDAVRDLVAAVLGHANRDAIGPEDSFFELGLDSLTALQIRNRLTDAIGLRLPVRVFYSNPTSTMLADYLYRQLTGAPE